MAAQLQREMRIQKPLVWIDLEMTGLDLEKDRILEIACIITDGDLNAVDEGIEFVIQQTPETMETMNPWCIEQHGKTGLTAACLASPHTHSAVVKAVMAYVRERIPDQRVALLAGSSVHADKEFLKLEEGRGMRELIDHLNYRIVDVSSVKELTYRWFPTLSKSLADERHAAKPAGSTHRALDDIKGSIAELRQYRERVFIQPTLENGGMRFRG